ncbi:hypothetical protein FJT64_023421 [Amphibalanus amphitrite]|uniref:Uncharacterized protein n=1 Tax=Amphibalanus amphitrite TaxID=1232801 RepID=A0A6A4WFR7_AMPAM|nr:hypothetical protein FJT64_023421 [Amphibalanus amphitrite]
MSLPSHRPTHAALLVTVLCAVFPACRGQAAWTARTPPSSADPFEALRSGEVFTLSEMSDRVGQHAPPPPAAPPPPPPSSAERPPFGQLQHRLPLRQLMARWACCRLSEDLVTWRDQCSPPERPAHGGWLTLQPGCACCNSTDSAADQLLECICHGANITAVPQTLPGAVSLM